MCKLFETLRLAILRLRIENLLLPALVLKELLVAKSRKNYSQFGEDFVLSQVCPPNGYYIDIGSGRPISGSNTFLLYRQGWSGTLIDPIRQNILLSYLLRRRDKKVHAAIGIPGETYFFHLYPYEYSTVSDVRAKNLIDNKKAQLVSKDKLNVIEIRKLFSGPVKGCLLLCIDVEGMDLQVLTSFPFEIQKPDVICVEETMGDTDNSLEIYNFLTNRGYRIYRRLVPSVIYVLVDSRVLKF